MKPEDLGGGSGGKRDRDESASPTRGRERRGRSGRPNPMEFLSQRRSFKNVLETKANTFKATFGGVHHISLGPTCGLESGFL
jgi:hypothetical protein